MKTRGYLDKEYVTKIKPSIRRHKMQYKYYKGHDLFNYYSSRSAQYLIGTEWNYAVDKFNNITGNSSSKRQLTKVQQEWKTRKLQALQTELKIVQLIDKKIPYASFNGEKKIKFWSAVFNNIEQKKKMTLRDCFYFVLGITEIDKMLYPLETRLYSTNFFTGQGLEAESKQSKRRKELLEYVFDYRKRIKNSGNKNIRDYFAQELSRELKLQTPAMLKQLKDIIDKTFEDFRKSGRRTNAEIFAKDFKETITIAVKNFCSKQKIKKDTVHIRIEGKDVMSIDILGVPAGDILASSLAKGSGRFTDSLYEAITKLTINTNYTSIYGKNIYLSAEIRANALKYLEKNTKEIKDINKKFASIVSKGYISGNIGEISALLKARSKKYFDNVMAVGGKNEFADIVFKLQDGESFGMNIKRYVSQLNSKNFEIYHNQEITSRNYHYFFTEEEIALLKYLKMNYNLIEEEFTRFTNVKPNIPADRFKTLWDNLLLKHTTDILRITSSTTTLGIDSNLFFVVNDNYIPLSLIYDYIINAIKKDKEVFIEKTQPLIYGASVSKETTGVTLLSTMGFSATQRGKGDFTANFKGFNIDFRKLYSLN